MAPVRGCKGGGVTGRGGDLVKGTLTASALFGRGGVANTENGSDGSCSWFTASCEGTDDSKKEKSASAQVSTVVWACDVSTGEVGGGDRSCLEAASGVSLWGFRS